MKRTSFFAAAIGLVLLAVGCSGSDSGASGAQATTQPDAAAPKNGPKPDGSPDATSAAPAAQTGSVLKAPVTFATLQPAMQAKCTPCHGGERGRGGFSIASYANVMKGGEDGAIVVKGNENSPLIDYLKGANGRKKMPPKGEGFSDDDIKLIAAWIKDGAKEK